MGPGNVGDDDMDEKVKGSRSVRGGVTDLASIRALEALIDILVRKGVIRPDELPRQRIMADDTAPASDEAQRVATKVVMDKADLAFIRVLEDLIDLLGRKGVIDLDELPDAARDKLQQRKMLRES